jgi:chromosome segregation ATPase
MPPDVSAALDALSQCAIQLGCPDASTATLLSAMSEMEDEIESLEQELLLNKAAVKDTRRRREQCEGRLAELMARERRLAEEFEEGKDDKIARARKVEYMTAKARQVTRLIHEPSHSQKHS